MIQDLFFSCFGVPRCVTGETNMFWQLFVFFWRSALPVGKDCNVKLWKAGGSWKLLNVVWLPGSCLGKGYSNIYFKCYTRLHLQNPCGFELPVIYSMEFSSQINGAKRKQRVPYQMRLLSFYFHLQANTCEVLDRTGELTLTVRGTKWLLLERTACNWPMLQGP